MQDIYFYQACLLSVIVSPAQVLNPTSESNNIGAPSPKVAEDFSLMLINKHGDHADLTALIDVTPFPIMNPSCL